MKTKHRLSLPKILRAEITKDYPRPMDLVRKTRIEEALREANKRFPLFYTNPKP